MTPEVTAIRAITLAAEQTLPYQKPAPRERPQERVRKLLPRGFPEQGPNSFWEEICMAGPAPATATLPAALGWRLPGSLPGPGLCTLISVDVAIRCPWRSDFCQRRGRHPGQGN